MSLRPVIYLGSNLGILLFRKEMIIWRTMAPIIFNFKILLFVTGSHSLRKPDIQSGLQYIK
jgi:hypothetical protein